MASSDTFQFLRCDYASQYAALVQRTQANFPGVWNDFSAGSFGIVLLDLMAYNLSTQAYLVNATAAENYLPTMQLRESAVRVGALVGYQLRNPAPSSVPCLATLSAPAASNVTIARGTRVQTSDAAAQPFEVAQAYTIPTGATAPSALVATFNPQLSGPQVIQALLAVTAGQAYANCLDTAVDLTVYLQVGQVLQAGGASYGIVAINTLPGAPAPSQLALNGPWTGVSGTVVGVVIDPRIFVTAGVTQAEALVSPSTVVPGYAYPLAFTPVIANAVAVTVNGVAWTQVDQIILSGPLDQAYQVRTLATGSTVVMFGDGTFGATLPSAATLNLSYRTGGGSATNISSGAINTSLIGTATALSNPVTVAITNAQPGVGGMDAESCDQARAQIPAWARTVGAAVTFGDYEALAAGYTDPIYGQVQFARAGLRGGNSLLEGNIVLVYAWTAGPGGSLVNLSSGLKASLRAYLQNLAVGTDYVVLADGNAVELPFACLVVASTGSSAPDVTALVLAQLQAYTNGLRPGQPLVFSTLLSLLVAVPGVASLTVATPAGDLQPGGPDTTFTPPDADGLASFELDLISTGPSTYTAESPAAPLTPWCFTATLDGNPLAVAPFAVAGYASLTGVGLDPSQPSLVNLLTGQVTLQVLGPVETMELVLLAVQGYETARPTDLYVSYQGDTSLNTRTAIRAALRYWGGGLGPGASLYVALTSASASASNAAAVVAAVNLVASVTRVTFDSPTNAAAVLSLSAVQRAVVRNIYVNNLIN